MATEPVTPLNSPAPLPIKDIGSSLMDNPGQWMESTLGDLTATALTWMPKLLGAVLILVIGWALAYAFRWLIHRFGKGLDALLASVNRLTGQQVSRPQWSVSTLAGNVAFWMTLMYAVSAAAELLGLMTFSQWILDLLGYLPRVLISGFILFIAWLISTGLRRMILDVADARGFDHGVPLSHLVTTLVLAFALLISLAQLGLDISLFNEIIVLAAAALMGGAALAFGLGASDSVKSVLASHYVRKVFRPGQSVRFGVHVGEIIEITATTVILETEDGEAMIPARQFLESVALVLDEEEVNRV